MNELLHIQREDSGIVTLTLHRPEAANALSIALLQHLKSVVDELKFTPSVRVVIISGSGNKTFCAGADLKERATMDDETVKKTVSLISETIQAVAHLPQPVIAAMNGSALGGGLELALACDLRIVSTHGLYGLTETTLAIIPGAGGTQRLPRLIGVGKAKELIFTGKRLTGTEAAEMGLAEWACSPKEVMAKAYNLAEAISKNGPIAIRQAKRAIDTGLEVDLLTGLKIEKLAYEQTISTADRLEGLKAFKEKRKPHYIGK
ncbi:enoyl-CoA hydratase [Halalkalibacterium ligniniphilum]|uniref:enoyl-CoA hydratase n=1 Tax=Halalkalibacterium ligniniphilum TaxID=1134413 RepID=UPI000345FBE7|nr:enoyl-CoA hydratase [Halalkalibacterium ligniniphilum]